MGGRSYGSNGQRELLNVEDVADADLRKSIFREMGKSLVQSMREGAVTDRPGSIAKLMEQAFRAGVKVAKADANFNVKDRLRRRMTEQDIPRLSRESLRSFRFFLSRKSELPLQEPLRAEALALFMRPKVPGMPSTISRDEWLVSNSHNFSNRIIGPLEKLKLIDCRDLISGWRMAMFNEWGFELLMTGETSFVEDRLPGRSSTVRRFLELVEEQPTKKAAIALGLFKDDEEPANEQTHSPKL